MADHRFAFAAGSVAGGRAELAAVATVFRTRRDVAPRVRETCLDSGDRALRACGALLSAIGDRDGTLLCLRGANGLLLHRLLVGCEPTFVHDLPASPLKDELAAVIGTGRLLVVLRIDARRVALRVEDEQHKTVARLALEHGTVTDPANGVRALRFAPTLEILPVRGYAAHAARLSRFLEHDRGLTPIESHRFERMLAAQGQAPEGRRAQPRSTLDPTEPAWRAMARVLGAQFDVMRRNENRVRHDRDTESLHDFRVAVRRARAVFGQIKHVFPANGVARLRDELRWLGEATNRLRDLDVHLADLRDHRATLSAIEQGGITPVEDALGRQRALEHSRIADLLASERHVALARDWERLLAQPHSAPWSEDLRNAERPIGRLVAKRIRRAHRVVLERGRTVGAESRPEELHDLRIDCKRLRYLIEQFRELFDGEALAGFVTPLKRLQDHLGRLNDGAVQRENLRRLKDEAAPCEAARLAPAIDSLVALLDARAGRELEHLRRELRSFDTRAYEARLRRALRADGIGAS